MKFDTTTNIMWALLIIALLLYSGKLLSQERITFHDNSDFDGWVEIDHESDLSTYFIKTNAVIAFLEPVPGDPKHRNGIVLVNGDILHTSLKLDKFQILMESK